MFTQSILLTVQGKHLSLIKTPQKRYQHVLTALFIQPNKKKKSRGHIRKIQIGISRHACHQYQMTAKQKKNW